KSDGTIPADRELARVPAVLLGPATLAVVRSAGVRNSRRHLQMIAWHGPETADRSQRRRSAGLMVLPDKRHLEHDAAGIGRRILEALHQGLEERARHLACLLERGGVIAEVVSGIRAARSQPFGERLLHERGQALEILYCLTRLGIAA